MTIDGAGIKHFDARDWYWIVANDVDNVWSSARRSLVGVTDKVYAAWLASGGCPTHIASMDELTKVLHLGLFDGADFLARLTDAEYGAILAAAAQNVQIARWLDIFRLRGEIDVTGSTALAAKAGLVAAKLLTQSRADVIFAPE